MYFSKDFFVEAGGLILYGASLADSDRRAAEHVDRILKGGEPAGIPIDQPTKFDLVINLKAARTLDLVIPPRCLPERIRSSNRGWRRLAVSGLLAGALPRYCVRASAVGFVEG